MWSLRRIGSSLNLKAAAQLKNFLLQDPCEVTRNRSEPAVTQAKTFSCIFFFAAHNCAQRLLFCCDRQPGTHSGNVGMAISSFSILELT